MQAYSDPSRENDPHALPDVEVFEMTAEDIAAGEWDSRGYELTEDGEPYEPGWYYWHCFPGCLPDSEAIGPFDSEQEALDDVIGWEE